MRPALVVACRDHGTPDEPVGLDPPTTSPPVGIPTLKPGRSAPHVKRRLFLHPGTVLRTQSPTDTVRAAGPAPAARLLLRYRNDALSLDVRKGPRVAPGALHSGPYTAPLTPAARRVPRTPAPASGWGAAGRAGPRAPRKRGPARGPGTYPLPSAPDGPRVRQPSHTSMPNAPATKTGPPHKSHAR